MSQQLRCATIAWQIPLKLMLKHYSRNIKLKKKEDVSFISMWIFQSLYFI